MRHVGRSGNMMTAHFGTPHEISTRDGAVRTVHDWTIQIQCPWRITQGTRIVIAFRDFYFGDAPLKNVDVMSKSKSNSLLDIISKEFEMNPPFVKAVDVEDTGDFNVKMSSDYQLEVFPTENLEPGKHWRIYEPGSQGRSFVFPPSEDVPQD